MKLFGLLAWNWRKTWACVSFDKSLSATQAETYSRNVILKQQFELPPWILFMHGGILAKANPLLSGMHHTNLDGLHEHVCGCMCICAGTLTSVHPWMKICNTFVYHKSLSLDMAYIVWSGRSVTHYHHHQCHYFYHHHHHHSHHHQHLQRSWESLQIHWKIVSLHQHHHIRICCLPWC